MKAHVVIAEAAVDDPRDHMLPGVLLHPVKPGLPVDGPDHGRSRLQGSVGDMEQQPRLLPGVQDVYIMQRPPVSRLAAALGKKAGFVQDHRPGIVRPGAAFQHCPRKFPDMGIQIVEFFCFHGRLRLKCIS